MNAKLMSYFMVISVSGKPLFDVKPVIKCKMLLIHLAIFHSNSMFDSFIHNTTQHNIYVCRSSIVHFIWELGGGLIDLHPEKITNIAWREFWRHGDYTVFAAWINGECCVVVNSMIYTLEEFYSETPTADVEQAARECVAELEQRRKDGGAA